MTEVILPPWRKLINEHFIPLIPNKDRYLILYGSRGSSKSDMVAKKLIKRCMTEEYFRYILYRKTYNTIKDSQYQNIKDIIQSDWRLGELFTFTESPLLIRCINGNRFLCRGGDNPEKLKSIKDPTGVWYEEDIPEEGDFTTITTSIRSSKAKYLQEVFTINPVVAGNYEDSWFWQRFFGKKLDATNWAPKHSELSFTDATRIKLPATFDKPEREEIFKYTVHHSTWRHNRWLTDGFIAQLLELKERDPYWYNVYTEGIWANRSTEGNFYKMFKRTTLVGDVEYNPLLPLHLTFDFNVHPHVTICVWQMVGKECKQIDEICLMSPKNRTSFACQHFAHKYRSHAGGVFIYGDPAGIHEDTRTEKGTNDFSLIGKELFNFRPQMRYQKTAPPVNMRGQFIDEIFFSNYGGITITIGRNCKKTIEEYENLKEAADGTKAKIKVKDKATGISYEQYGHISDANDYFLCTVFQSDFQRYQIGGFSTGKVRMAKHISRNSY
jgi:phage terminase large subunit